MGLFDWLFGRRKPKPAPRPAPAPPPARSQPPLVPIDLNVHHLTEETVPELRRLHVKRVRWTLYWSLWCQSDDEKRAAYRADARAAVARALAAGLELLVCAHETPVYHGDEWTHRRHILTEFAGWLAARAAEWPEVVWQPWNEVDGDTFTRLFSGGDPSIGPRDRGALYGAHLTAVLDVVPPGTRIVAAAPGGDDPGAFVDGMLSTVDVGRLHAVAVHAYGTPIAAAMVQRAAAVRAALERRGSTLLPWCTEVGITGPTMQQDWGVPPELWEARQQREWAGVAAAAPGVVGRVYGYDWDGADGYAIRGTETARWLAGEDDH